MKLAESIPSNNWTMENLENALQKLENNKSRDFEGYVNELFKKDVVGDSFINVQFNEKKKADSKVYELLKYNNNSKKGI